MMMKAGTQRSPCARQWHVMACARHTAAAVPERDVIIMGGSSANADGICESSDRHILPDGEQRKVIATQSSLADASQRLLHDRKRVILLAGHLVSAAVMALHGTLVPFQLQQQGVFAEPGDLGVLESAAGLAFALALLLAGCAVDAVGEQLAVRALV